MGIWFNIRALYDRVTIKELAIVMLVLLGLILAKLSSIDSEISGTKAELGKVRWAIDATRM